MQLLDLIVATPKCWAVTLLSDWLELPAVMRLDSAFCMKRHRACVLDRVNRISIAEMNTEKLKDGGVRMVDWIESRTTNLFVRSLQLTDRLCCHHRVRQTLLHACGNSLRSVQLRASTAIDDTFLATYNPPLTSVEIVGGSSSFTPAIVFAKCNHLISLVMISCKLPPSFVTALSNFCPLLETLTLESCIIQGILHTPHIKTQSLVRKLSVNDLPTELLHALFAMCSNVVELFMSQVQSVEFAESCRRMPLVRKCTLIRRYPHYPITDYLAQLISQHWSYLEEFWMYGIYFPSIVESSVMLMARVCPRLHTLVFAESVNQSFPAMSTRTFAHAAVRDLQVGSFHQLSSHNIVRLICECPRLHTLHVRESSHASNAHPFDLVTISSALQHVYLDDCCYVHWQVLLTSHRLITLSLQHCPTLTDEIVIALAEHNPELKFLHVRGFVQLTYKSILAVVRQCEVLEDVTFVALRMAAVSSLQHAVILELMREIRASLKSANILL